MAYQTGHLSRRPVKDSMPLCCVHIEASTARHDGWLKFGAIVRQTTVGILLQLCLVYTFI